jgi:lipase
VLLQLHEWGDASAPPVVCVHGINAHGRRFRRLAEERLASGFRVLAPDLRGGRLVLELAALAPDRIDRAVLLDPAIQLLPHVGFDFAERERTDRAYDSPEEPIVERLDAGAPTPREYLEEENREHLVQHRDGKFRFRYCPSAVISMYGELCTPAPPPETLRVPTLLVHAGDFGLVREEQLDAYGRALGDRLRVIQVLGSHIVYWDAYEETADAIDSFLEDPRA